MRRRFCRVMRFYIDCHFSRFETVTQVFYNTCVTAKWGGVEGNLSL